MAVSIGDNEGANAIAACIGCPTTCDTRGSFIRIAYRSECDDLGGDICAMLREAAEEHQSRAV